jgi:hypothetical protein
MANGPHALDSIFRLRAGIDETRHFNDNTRRRADTFKQNDDCRPEANETMSCFE